MTVQVANITKRFRELTLYANFSLEFPSGQITALLGPSGCGKTTLLNILAGLVAVDAGTVTTEAPVSYIFQEPRLLPWLSLHANLELVLADRMPAAETKEKVAMGLAATDLTDYADYYPNQVSGGMRQRAALARAFIHPSALLLMDEPFQSQDIKTHYQMVQLFLRLWRTAPRTVVTVTHSIQEALWLADQIVVLSAKPTQLLERFELTEPQETRMAHYDRLQSVEQRVMQALLG